MTITSVISKAPALTTRKPRVVLSVTRSHYMAILPLPIYLRAKYRTITAIYLLEFRIWLASNIPDRYSQLKSDWSLLVNEWMNTFIWDHVIKTSYSEHCTTNLYECNVTRLGNTNHNTNLKKDYTGSTTNNIVRQRIISKSTTKGDSTTNKYPQNNHKKK